MSESERSSEGLHGDESYIAEQERAAAEEAAAIGGSVDDEHFEGDESERALAEAGQGEAEGFELAEEELIENASHDADATPDPGLMAGLPGDLRTDAEFGEADSESKADS